MSTLILPDGVEVGAPGRLVEGRGTVVNETDLPDSVVMTLLEENASVLGVSSGSTFQTYANSTGSILARGRWRVPTNTLEEIILARDLADRDDDCRATIGSMLAVAFGDGWRNTAKDEVASALYDEAAKFMRLGHLLEELYREWLIASQVTTLAAFQSQQFSFQPQGADRQRARTIRVPRVGVIPAEQIVPIGNDLLGTAPLFYRPGSSSEEAWLREFFAPETSPGRKAEMRQQDPLLTMMLIEQRRITDYQVNALYESDNPDPPSGEFVYRLNPSMVHRSTMPKGKRPHPKPLMCANFPLLEAKRLLNLMDYALLEGGSNFLVVAKKGTDERPARPEEVANLRDVLKRASRTGLIVGDHRLNIEIVTPDMTELLNSGKRKLIGRKIAKALLRIPDYQEQGEGSNGVLADVEILSRVIGSDRATLACHLHHSVYEDIQKRNDNVTEAACLWFPKIILQGAQYFTDLVLKLADRGSISRQSAVEAAGFDYNAEVAQRKREKQSGDDKILTPPMVPFSSPQGASNAGAAPAGQQPGLPPGAHAGVGRPRGARTGADASSRTQARAAGEVVAVRYDDDHGTYRIGECTYAALEEFADTRQVGRVTTNERAALQRIDEGDEDMFAVGNLTVIPVNNAYEIGRDSIKAVRLGNGLSLLVGQREDDDALVTRAIVGRRPDVDELGVDEFAWSLGFGDSDSGDLLPAERRRLRADQFALPESREYPIHDETAAAAALERAERYESGERLARVRKAVSDLA